MGVQQIIIFFDDFPWKNHPAIGVPPWFWNSESTGQEWEPTPTSCAWARQGIFGTHSKKRRTVRRFFVGKAWWMVWYLLMNQFDESIHMKTTLVGGLEHDFYGFPYIYICICIYTCTYIYILGMSSSQLTFTPSFFRVVGLNHQPEHIKTSEVLQFWRGLGGQSIPSTIRESWIACLRALCHPCENEKDIFWKPPLYWGENIIKFKPTVRVQIDPFVTWMILICELHIAKIGGPWNLLTYSVHEFIHAWLWLICSAFRNMSRFKGSVQLPSISHLNSSNFTNFMVPFPKIASSTEFRNPQFHGRFWWWNPHVSTFAEKSTLKILQDGVPQL